MRQTRQNSCPGLLQQFPAFLAHKGDRHKFFRWRPYIIHHPLRIMMRQHFADAVCPVTHGVRAFVPVKQLYPVVQLLLLVVDGHLNSYLLLTRERGDRNDNVTHSAYVMQLFPQEDCHILNSVQQRYLCIIFLYNCSGLGVWRPETDN